MASTHLLVIDPQNDFCDLPPELCPPDGSGGRLSPSLPVPGAHADMLRLSGWLGRNASTSLSTGLSRIDAITVTLDHHHRLDIAHPGFWRTRSGDVVAPFTPITAASVKDGQYRVAPGLDADRALAYLESLEASGGFTHMVWPVHCQIGTWGQCIHPSLQATLDAWEDATGRSVSHLLKGENPWTEHFSALQAEVPDPSDAATGLNLALLERLAQSDRVLIAGEAGSHCVRATVEHLVKNWTGALSRLVLLTDCMSPVTGFEAAQEAFLGAMSSRGLRLAELDRI